VHFYTTNAIFVMQKTTSFWASTLFVESKKFFKLNHVANGALQS